MLPVALDHCVIHVTDWQRSNKFYVEVMGAALITREVGFAYRFGDRQLNAHGPGVKPAEVARHQKARLEGAMVEAVSRHGFAGTTLAELVTLAGVAKTTFYQHFDNKEDCFLAAFASIILERLARVAPGVPVIAEEEVAAGRRPPRLCPRRRSSRADRTERGAAR